MSFWADSRLSQKPGSVMRASMAASSSASAGASKKPPERAETVGKPGGIQSGKVDLCVGHEKVKLQPKERLPKMLRLGSRLGAGQAKNRLPVLHQVQFFAGNELKVLRIILQKLHFLLMLCALLLEVR